MQLINNFVNSYSFDFYSMLCGLALYWYITYRIEPFKNKRICDSKQGCVMSPNYQYRRRYQNIETGKGLFFSLSNEEFKTARQEFEAPDKPISANPRDAQPIDRQKVSVDKSDLWVALICIPLMAISIVDQRGIVFLVLFFLFLITVLCLWVRPHVATNGKRLDSRFKNILKMVRIFLGSLVSDRDIRLAWSVMKVYSER